MGLLDPETLVRRYRASKEGGAPGYPDAGVGAPEGVQQAIAEFSKLPAEERAEKPLLWWLLGASTPAYKMAPDEAAYVSPSTVTGQTCGNCSHAYKHITSGKLLCDQMRGNIVPEAWCRFWEGAEAVPNPGNPD